MKINSSILSSLFCKHKKGSKSVLFINFEVTHTLWLVQRGILWTFLYVHSIPNHFFFTKFIFSLIQTRPFKLFFQQDLRSNTPEVIQQNLHIPCCIYQGRQEHLLSLLAWLLQAEFSEFSWITSATCWFNAFSWSFLFPLSSCPVTHSWCAFLLEFQLCASSFPYVRSQPSKKSFLLLPSMSYHIFISIPHLSHWHKAYQTCSVQKSQQPTCTYIYILNITFKYIREAKFYNLISFTWFLVILKVLV